METSTFSRCVTALLLILIQRTLAGTNYGNYIMSGYKEIDDPQIYVDVTHFGGSTEKCQYKLLGRGVVDSLVDDCPYYDYTQINTDNYYTYFYPQYSPLGFYSDTRGTLVIIKGTGCRLRTYQRTGDKTTPTESVLSTEVCDKIKKRLDDEMVAVKDYWSKWQINFERKMKKLPPLYDIVDPLKYQPPTASLYAGQPGVPVSSSTTDTNSGLPAQPLTPNLPSQPTSSSSQTGGPTILGLSSIHSDENKISRNYFSTSRSTINDGNKCTLEHTIFGNGVHDCFKMTCGRTPNLLSIGGFIMLGHPDFNTFSLFSDERATLYLFENGWCTKKTYTTNKGVTTSKAEPLSPEDCRKAKKKFKNTLKRKGISVSPNGGISIGSSIPVDSSEEILHPPSILVTGALPSQPSSPSNTGVGDVKGQKILVSTSFPQTSNGQCQVEISVLGKGVKDKFTEPCSDKPVDSVSTDGVFIFGDPYINSLTLYTTEPNVLYVVKNKICTKKTYTTTNGETKSIRTPLRIGKCNELRRSISKLLSSQKTQPSAAPSSIQTPAPVATPAVTPAPSSIQTPSPVATPAVFTTPADLQQFVPTYPFPLGNSGKDGKYDMTVNQMTNSFNVKGCYNYITVKGKGINDHFQVPCSDESSTAVSTRDFMFFGTPTSTLGLFSDTPSTLIILTKGTCFKKTYGVTPTGPTPMEKTECDEVKKRMLDRMDTNGKVINGGMKVSGSNYKLPKPTGASNIHNNYPGSTPTFGNTFFNPPPFGIPYGTTGQFGPSYMNPSFLGPQPLDTSDQPSSAATSSTSPGVTWRDGDFSRIYSSAFYVDIKKPDGETCSIEIVGRGLNDLIQDSCSVLGNSIKKVNMHHILAVTNPTKQSGLYSDQWGVLVFVREGRCFKKTYNTNYGEQTKITTTEMTSYQCNKVKDSISSTMGVSFGQAPGSTSDNTPTWREGIFGSVYNGNPTVNIKKNDNGPNDCTIEVTLIGRGLNDEISGSCSEMGTNVRKKVTAFSLAVADPSTTSGIYTEDWGSLIVIKNGQCTLRKYDSDAVKNTTKITSSPAGKARCDWAKRKLSGVLGANFG